MIGKGTGRQDLSHLREGIRLKKDFVQAHFWLAATYRSLGKNAEADAEMAEVARIHQQNPRAQAEEAPHTRERLFSH